MCCAVLTQTFYFLQIAKIPYHRYTILVIFLNNTACGPVLNQTFYFFKLPKFKSKWPNPHAMCIGIWLFFYHYKFGSNPSRPGLRQAWDCLHAVRSTVTRSGLKLLLLFNSMRPVVDVIVANVASVYIMTMPIL